MFNGRTQDREGLSACKDRYFQTALLKSPENTCQKAGIAGRNASGITRNILLDTKPKLDDTTPEFPV